MIKGLPIEKIEEFKDNLNDDIIINFFFYNNILLRNKINDSPDYVKEYIKNRYDDSLSLEESVFRIKHNINKRPVCPMCGGNVLFIGKESKWYQKFCSLSCLGKNNANVIENKYGVRSTLRVKEVQEKVKESCLKHYGVDHNWKAKEVREKCYETSKERWGNDYLSNHNEKMRKKTKLERYGDENYVNVKKHNQTMLSRYGYVRPMQNKEKNKEIVKKIFENRKKNHTTNTSKIEEDLYRYFIYRNIEVKRQYESELYPFHSDFYLPKYDLYIEIQGNWTHGFMPYEKDNPICIEQLNKWKSTNTEYYKSAIENWTISDVEKRNIAKENGINYLEIFTIKYDDCVKLINDKIKELSN